MHGRGRPQLWVHYRREASRAPCDTAVLSIENRADRLSLSGAAPLESFERSPLMVEMSRATLGRRTVASLLGPVHHPVPSRRTVLVGWAIAGRTASLLW
jgi:hypothetical protein